MADHKTPKKTKSKKSTISMEAFSRSPLEITSSEAKAAKGNPLLIPIVSDIDTKDLKILSNFVKSKTMDRALQEKSIFAKNQKEITYFPSNNSNHPYIMLLGLGKKEKLGAIGFANALISALDRCFLLKWEKISLVIAPHLHEFKEPEEIASWIASLAELSRFKDRFLTSPKSKKNEYRGLKKIEIVFLSTISNKNRLKNSIKEGKILGISTNYAREAVNLPGNMLTPQDIAQRAQEAGKKFGFSVKTLNMTHLKKMGMNGIISVGKGAKTEPKLIIMEYKGLPKKKSLNLGIIGKGITFDSGGISLKSSTDMHEMKGDMGGAAAALYGLTAIAAAKLPINVTSMIGAAENMPGANAQRPGDVYKSYKGLTVEVLNTDAEGRLVLADLLTYMAEFKPEYMVDIATLTGACLMALGTHLAGLFANNKKFQDRVFNAGERSLDRVWPLPLYDEYMDDIKGDLADLANIGPKAGGAITAASFLKNFVPGDTPWAHLDIAGKFMLKKDAGFHRKGGTGFGVRLLFELAKSLIS